MFNLNDCEYFKNKDTAEKFRTFKNLLTEKNKQFNLTSITDESEIYVKHFFDSIRGGEKIFENADVIEIGSGGGFPSVPLKIFRENINLTLVEATSKKCVFLNEVKSLFRFSGFEIINDRCESLAKKEKYREKFDFSIARAVAPLNSLCEYMLPFVKIGGFMLAYKGEANKEIENAKNAIEILGGRFKETDEYSLPNGLGDRQIVIIEKIKPTPDAYPRGLGKERSKPL